MPLVLAIEPDLRQAAIVKRIVREKVLADVAVVDSPDAALEAMRTSVPDVLLISVLRSVIGIILRGFAELLHPSPSAAARPSSQPSGGELKKDPVCGTFIAAATSIQKKVGGQTYYFCSPECRDKFK